MTLNSISGRATAFNKLREFADSRAPQARCEFCSATLFPEHRHVLELANRKIVCACDACAFRFPPGLASRFKLIPRDSFLLPDFHLSDAQWNDLAIPINLAFLAKLNGNERVVAFYPGPAGVTESQISPANWDGLQAENPVLAQMEPDVEMLLVNRVGANREYYLAPIDVGYALTGLLRLHWRGLSGGEAVWQKIDEFFARLKGGSKPRVGSSEERVATTSQEVELAGD